MRGVGILATVSACSFTHGSLQPGDARTEPVDGVADSSDSRGLDSQTCLTPPSGLVAFWPADGDAQEIIGGRDGSFVDDANAAATGRVGKAFAFDGDLDQVTIANPPTSTAFTIEAWINFDSDEANYRTVYAAAQRGFWTRDGRITWWQTSERYASTGSIPLGAFHHVALTYNGATFAGYIDGVTQGTASYSGASLPGGSATGIGGHGNEYVTGQIDEVSVYDRALTEAEINAIVAAVDGKCR
jgi:hypothetical protein